MIRSNKLQTLSDTQILERYTDNPKGEERYFLGVEIEQRNLQEQADIASKKHQKGARHSVVYYLVYLFLFGMFVSRFGSQLF